MYRKLMFYKVANNGIHKVKVEFMVHSLMSLEAKLCFSLMCHIWLVGKE